MFGRDRRNGCVIATLALLILTLVAVPVFAQSEVMGTVEFSGATNVEKSSGVWIDGQYVGYLKELKGAKKITLLPGKHEIAVRQSGYADFTQEITLEPQQTQTIRVAMQKAPRAVWSKQTAELKIDVQPDRAAVFVDDSYAGHAGEFGGAFHSMLLVPGKHRVKIELPGYQPFETEVNLLIGQKAEVKTKLEPGSIEQAGQLIKKQDSESNER